MNKLIEALDHTPTGIKAGMDIGAVTVAWGGLFMESLPVVASGLSIIWLSLQIYGYIVHKRWRK